MIAALFVQPAGCYASLPGVDPWPEARDARTYPGPHPVVAHPPCARWCRLAGLVQARYPHLRKGEDGGCFASALSSVRRWGGVLEHPAWSDAWPAHGLPAPDRGGGWLRTPCGGWTCYVEQGHYGHRARKPTWLYAHGIRRPPRLTWGKAADSEVQPRRRGGEVQQMSVRHRSATPTEFRDLLLSIAQAARREP